MASSMTATAHQLPDGSLLLDHKVDGDGRPFGLDEKTSKRCTFIGDEHGGRLVNRNGDTVREIVPQAAAAQSPAKVAASTSRSTGGRGRWLTFNTFVDRVARHLELHEQAAWMVIYRAVQDDTAEVSMDDIAAKIGRSTRTAKRAVDRLVEVGLLERLRRGTKQSGPTRYRLEADPVVALLKLAPATASQRDTGGTLKRTPKHQKRDRRGAFST